MAKYLVQASYNSDGIKGVLKEGASGRVKAVSQMIESVGGSVESFYFGFGETDVYVIADMPDNSAAAAVAAAVGASGAIAGYKTTVLLTPEEVDAGLGRTVSYRPPGA